MRVRKQWQIVNKNITNDQLAYIAGIIDSEGSIEVRYEDYYCKIRRKIRTIRHMKIRISTCDNKIIPKISEYTHTKCSSKDRIILNKMLNELKSLNDGFKNKRLQKVT